MDLLALGVQLLQQKFGDHIGEETITNALSSLLGGSGGNLDLGGLVQQMMGSGGLQSVVSSWLGDGSNSAISPTQIVEMFGADKLAGFASQMGVDEPTASAGLADVLPQLVDKASSGGSLLDQAGGVGGLFDAAKKLF